MTTKEFYDTIIDIYSNSGIVGEPNNSLAPYPEFDPLIINARCFNYHLRPKSYRIAKENDTLLIEWQYNASATMTDSLIKEIARFLCACYKKYELIEPIKAEIHARPRFYEQALDIEVIGIRINGYTNAQLYKHQIFTEEELKTRVVGKEDEACNGCSITKGTRKDYYSPSELYNRKSDLADAIFKGRCTRNKKYA